MIYFLGHCVWCKWLFSTCTNCVDKKRVANQRDVGTVPPVPQDFLTIVHVEICLMKTNLKQPHYCKGNLHKENTWSRNMTVISMSVVLADAFGEQWVRICANTFVPNVKIVNTHYSAGSSGCCSGCVPLIPSNEVTTQIENAPHINAPQRPTNNFCPMRI